MNDPTRPVSIAYSEAAESRCAGVLPGSAEASKASVEPKWTGSCEFSAKEMRGITWLPCDWFHSLTLLKLPRVILMIGAT